MALHSAATRVPAGERRAPAPPGRAAGPRHPRHWVQVVLYKAFAELRADSERYYVGYLWWVVEPVIEMAIWYIVFAQLLQRYTENFVAFLLCGLVPWRWFSAALMGGSWAIVANHRLAMQVYIPKIVFPLTTIVVCTARFAIVLALLALFLNLYGIPAGWSYLAIPAVAAVQLLFIAALTVLAAAVVPFVPSVRVALDAGIKIGFALSGIFFSLDALPASARWWLSLNPMAAILDAWRDVLMHQRVPDWRILGVIAALSLPGLLAGRALVRRYDYLYPKLTP